MKKLAVGLFVLGALVFGAMTLYDWTLLHPYPGQSIEPNVAKARTPSGQGEPVRYSLYEYFDNINYRTTGKSIHFDIPDNLTAFIGMNGGPTYTIRIQYDPNGDKPYHESPAFTGNNGAFDPRLTGMIGLELTFVDDVGPWTKDVILRGKATSVTSGLPDRPPLKDLDISYCGFSSFGRADPTARRGTRYPAVFERPKDQRWPFDDAVVLAKPLADHSFSSLTTCTDGAMGDGFPYCNLKTSYRGWPMTLRFSGRRVCEADEMIAHATRVLDRFRVSESERSPKYSESRHLKWRE
jgi:hypothetical protein